MPEVTLKAIEQLLDLKLDEKLNKKLEPIEATLRNHTKILESLVSKKQTKDESQTVTTHRLDRLEKWGKRIGNHVGVKLEL